jgi:predicted transcriptional regulator
MANATVRITSQARDVLRKLAESEGETMQRVLEKAIQQYRRRHFLEEANAAFAALRADGPAWEAELEERRIWDASLGDGLGDQ